jgi:hypothetical protein
MADFGEVNRPGRFEVRTLLFVATGSVVVVAAVASAALAVGMPGNGHARVTRADLKGVNFVENCAFSHRAPDDPIVHAGMPGMSHERVLDARLAPGLRHDVQEGR